MLKPMGSPGVRSYGTAKFNLELDGLNAGWIWSVEGGMPVSEVVTEKLGPDHLLHKHISGIKYEDISLTFGTSMSNDFWVWVSDSFSQKYSRRNGALVSANYDHRETKRLTFYNALVSEISFPGLDAASKDPSKVTVKVVPEYSRIEKGTGGLATGPTQRQKQHLWSPANFRFKIDGLDTSRVMKVEPFVLRQKVTQYQVGELRDYQVEPVQVEYPNLVITVAEAYSESFDKWYNSFVLQGKCDESGEKTGSLEYVTPNLRTSLLRLDFAGLGIFKTTTDKADSSVDGIRKVKYELYCHQIKFVWNPQSFWG